MKDTTSHGLAGLLIGIVLSTLAFAGWFRHSAQNTQHSARRISLSHPHPVTHPIHQSMEFFARQVDELSGGTLRVDIFPSSQLGNETKVIEQMQRGSVGFCVIGSATVGNFVPVIRLFSLPYLFHDEDHYWRVLSGPVGRELLGEISRLENGNPSGLTGIEFFDAGSRSFYTRNEVRSMEDLRGLKIRVIAEPVSMDAVAAMGGAPTPVPWGELYTALQQGMVDGAENNPPSLLSSRHYEAAKHYSLNEHTRVPDVLLMSLQSWERLPEHVQAWVQQAADESVVFQRKLWAEKTQESIEQLEAAGVQVYRPDPAPFAEAARPLREAHEGTLVGELAKRIEAMP